MGSRPMSAHHHSSFSAANTNRNTMSNPPMNTVNTVRKEVEYDMISESDDLRADNGPPGYGHHHVVKSLDHSHQSKSKVSKSYQTIANGFHNAYKRANAEFTYQNTARSDATNRVQSANTTRGRSNVSHANVLFGDPKFDRVNSSVMSEASKQTKPGSADVQYDHSYPHKDRVNSNYINNVDLAYHSKAKWHRQGPLSHDIMMSADPRDIVSKCLYFQEI